MVFGVNDIDHSYEDRKLPDSVRVIEPEMIKNDAYSIHHVTSIVYYRWNRKRVYIIYLDYLKIFVCVRWSFGQWFDDNGVCLSSGSIKKAPRLARAFHAHQHTSLSGLGLRLLTLFGHLTLTQVSPVIFGSKGTRRKAEGI
jgi:hypothetical protein